MQGLLHRPVRTYDPGRELLANEHFQVAYVTGDLDRAAAAFARRFAIRDFADLEGEMPAGGYIRVKLAWVGGIMYELIQCTGPGSDMYNGRLPDEGFAIRFHHLGFLVADQSSWDALQSRIEADGWAVPQANNTPGFMRHCYIEVPELGHFCEYIFPEQAGVEFFERVPAS